MHKKKDPSNKTRPPLSSEKRTSDILAHEKLAHEDKDPIYPFEPVQGQKKDNAQGPKHKKRKAG